MNLIFHLLFAAFVSGIAYVYFVVRDTVPDVPALNERWWGPGERVQEEKHFVKSFTINVSDAFLEDLKHRLEHTRPLTPSLEGAKQRYGIHSNFVDKVLDYWKNIYNWKEREKLLNKYPQYKVNIQGLNIHFLRGRPKLSCDKSREACKIKVLPLIIFHGFYSSFREFYDLIPFLTTPQKDRNYVFELIIPSLPGFGFSDGAIRPGLSESHMAVIFQQLMEILGFEKYYIQGGDWGAKVAENMAILYPKNVLGVHLNFCTCKTNLAFFKELVGQIIPSLIYTEEEKKICFSETNSLKYMLEESGYFHFQATKPDTIGVALNESPIGLAAYFIEKLTSLTNPAWRDTDEGDLTLKIPLEKILDNIMIYYISGSITTAMRIYAEYFTKEDLAKTLERCPIMVPSACARFPNEIFLTPRSILEIKHWNLIQLTDFKDGGHFAAFEQTELLAKDIFDFVEKVRRLK